MKEKPLTEKQRRILENGANGFNVRGQWFWTIDLEPCGREVRSLEKRGLVSCTYYTGGKAGAWVTAKGLALIEKEGGR